MSFACEGTEVTGFSLYRFFGIFLRLSHDDNCPVNRRHITALVIDPSHNANPDTLMIASFLIFAPVAFTRRQGNSLV